MSITSEGMGLTNTIQGISPLKINDRIIGMPKSDGAGGGAFSSIFKDSIQTVRDTDAQFVNDQYLLATGQLDNPAAIGISAYKNEIAVDLLIQLRNKALDVYNQLTSLSI